MACGHAADDLNSGKPDEYFSGIDFFSFCGFVHREMADLQAAQCITRQHQFLQDEWLKKIPPIILTFSLFFLTQRTGEATYRIPSDYGWKLHK